MANAIITNKSVSVSTLMSTGTDSAGNLILATTSFPKTRSSADPEKLKAISEAFAQIGVGSLYTTKRRTVNIVSE